MLKCTSRSGARYFMVEEPIFDSVEKWYTSSGHATFSKTEKHDDPIFLDGGGSMRMGEPTVDFEANGVKFKTFLRHIPYMESYFRNAILTDGWIKFGGWPCFVFCLSTATRDAAIAELNRIMNERMGEIKTLEYDLIHDLSEAGVKYMGKCGCQSGVEYKKCCGRRN